MFVSQQTELCILQCVALFGAAHFFIMLKMEDLKMALPEEYTKLFNTVTDTIETLEKLIYELRLAQINAEEKVIAKADEE